ncbi:hypothetical protein [Ideonella paludis]
MPDITTVCRRKARLQIALTYRPSSSELQVLANSSDIKFLGEGQ